MIVCSCLQTIRLALRRYLHFLVIEYSTNSHSIANFTNIFLMFVVQKLNQITSLRFQNGYYKYLKMVTVKIGFTTWINVTVSSF